ncbi:MAG TPA: PQQ-binding-like beta-propeller repeat protein [Vicinamibacterales bacterium]|nr:PQQ-binding-like beta-propeller repeat protein [Vicinamibacterales bacterium]
MFRPSARVLLVVVLVAVRAQAQEWPEFRGPTGQGHAGDRGVPSEWSEARNVAWKTPIPGLGWSSPVVGGGRVWLTTATGDREVSLRAVAYDVETGREVVNVEVFRLRSLRDLNPKNSWASPTPILEGDRVYVHFGADGTAALTTAGDVVWKTKFPYESQHGAGGSPVLFGDLLIFSCDGSDAAFVVALDKKTGKTRWKTHRRTPADQAYTTPLVIRVGERDQVISIGAFRVGAYDPANGKEIWRASYADGFSNVPRPVYGHGLVYIATGFQQPSLIAVRPDGSGDVTRTHIAWALKRGAPFTPSPVMVGDELYVLNDGGILTAVDARTGNILWQQRLGGSYSASPLFVDGKLYFSSEESVTTVLVPGKEFRRIATNRLEGAMLASIAVSNGALFIRTDSHLYKLSNTP